MSLREEISEFLASRNVEYPTHTTDDILSKIVKRIDEKIKIDREVVTNLLKNKQSLHSEPLIRLTSRIDGYIGIKEMLK